MNVNQVKSRVKRMHIALSGLNSEDISEIQASEAFTSGYLGSTYYAKLDFNFGIEPDELKVLVFTLVHNIASLKDHLNEWCKSHPNTKFKGDDLINCDVNVSIVHDLWNLDKHFKLKFSPRSGFTPELRDISRDIAVNPGSAIEFDFYSGEIKSEGDVGLKVNAKVVDESGAYRGDFSTICVKAIEAWEKTLFDTGIPF